MWRLNGLHYEQRQSRQRPKRLSGRCAYESWGADAMIRINRLRSKWMLVPVPDRSPLALFRKLFEVEKFRSPPSSFAAIKDKTTILSPTTITAPQLQDRS